MAETKERRSNSRLQNRAPASIQVNPASSFASGWKVAIPLLSPLVLSPTSPPKFGDRTVETSSQVEESSRQMEKQTTTTTTFKSWQHPAVPFHYEPAAPFLQSFVPQCR